MAFAARRIVLPLLVLAAASAPAATYYVDRFADVPTATACLDAVPQDCSLRGAILKANATAAADTIVLGRGTYALTVPGSDEDLAATGDLDLREDVTIAGQGAGITTVRAEVPDRVFAVIGNGVGAVFRRFTITNGTALGSQGSGGGIFVSAGSLTLEQCEVADNLSAHNGGGISVWGGSSGVTSLVLHQSNVSGNQAFQGGGLWIWGPSTPAQLTIEDSAITGNLTESIGAGLEANDTTGVVRNSTVSGNQSIGGGSVSWGAQLFEASLVIDSSTFVATPHNAFEGSDSTVVFRNSLISGACSFFSGGELLSQGGNLESPGASCHFGASDLEYVADPGLEPLGKYGGSTLTHRLVSTSPAVDFALADANCEPHDQRGIARPQAAGTPGPAHCDIGAYERVNRELFLDGFEGGTWMGWSGWSQ